MHDPAARETPCKGANERRQCIGVDDNQRRGLSPDPETVHIAITTQQRDGQPGQPIQDTKALSLLAGMDKTWLDAEVAKQIVNRFAALLCEPHAVLEAGCAGEREHRCKLYQLRARADNENTLPHRQDCL